MTAATMDGCKNRNMIDVSHPARCNTVALAVLQHGRDTMDVSRPAPRAAEYVSHGAKTGAFSKLRRMARTGADGLHCLIQLKLTLSR